MLKTAKVDQETFGKGQQIKKGAQQWRLVLSSLICCLSNNKSQASCDFMVLHFPSDIGVKTLALLRGKWSKNSQQNSAALTQPTCQQFGPFTKKLFSKPEIFAAAQSQAAVLRETQPWEVCTPSPPCLRCDAVNTNMMLCRTFQIWQLSCSISGQIADWRAPPGWGQGMNKQAKTKMN